jgi:DNA-binding HxlR family transcriptional regulator
MESVLPTIDPFDPQCPGRRALDLLADRWTSLTIYTLASGTLRYSALRRALPNVSHKMLTQTLRKLEREGLVRREVYPVVPPQVEYSLTPFGETLLEPLAVLIRWSQAAALAEQVLRETHEGEPVR